MLAGISEWTKQFTIKCGTKDLKVNAQWSPVRDPRETQSPEDYFQFQTSGQCLVRRDKLNFRDSHWPVSHNTIL